MINHYNDNLMNSNFNFAVNEKKDEKEQPIKKKDLENFQLISTDNHLNPKEDNSFYCLSNLINSANDNQISHSFVCLWVNCNKILNSQRELVSRDLI